jgi:2-dehydro-3-deoxygalactonokinase
MTNQFLSLDWGTSSFRLRLVEAASLQVIAGEISDQGIAGTFHKWKETQHEEPAARISFYTQVMAVHIATLEKRLGRSLRGLPLLLSGMASSSIGLLELPYRHLPFAIDGTGMKPHLIKAGPAFPHDIFLISGVRSENDVMRGEETQLIGAIPQGVTQAQDGVFIFPGTHSKHMVVQGNQVVAFKTYMTGEFFDLLAKKSILNATVSRPAGLPGREGEGGFEKGVREAVGANLLHAAFLVRTNHLFGVLNPEENFNYLSGLLIGTELQELLQYPGGIIYLFGGAKLKTYYEAALQALGLADKVHSFPAQWVDESVIRGQYRIFQHFEQEDTSGKTS